MQSWATSWWPTFTTLVVSRCVPSGTPARVVGDDCIIQGPCEFVWIRVGVDGGRDEFDRGAALPSRSFSEDVRVGIVCVVSCVIST
jgi:hypothetical protein